MIFDFCGLEFDAFVGFQINEFHWAISQIHVEFMLIVLDL
jgi:hypothetical protein